MSQTTLFKPGRELNAYFSDDTIVAPASAVGGPIAIVRLSGPLALKILEKMVGDRGLKRQDPQKLFWTVLKSPDGKTLDRCMAVHFLGEKSFTGEAVVEIHCHGGPATVEGILNAAEKLGARMALPGEFSFRAIRNGKMTVFEAQAIHDLIAAETQEAATNALEKMTGTGARTFERVAEELEDLLVFGELSLDFSDQDVPELDLDKLKKIAKEIGDKLGALADTYRQGAVLQKGLSIAIVGQPNSGKSTLFNEIVGENRAIVSDRPGTTRDTLDRRFKLRNDVTGREGFFNLIDTAGVRTVSDDIEREGIARGLSALEEADLVLWVIDSERTGHEATDPAINDAVLSRTNKGRPVAACLSKTDLVNFSTIESKAEEILKQWPFLRAVLPVSVRTGAGIGALKEFLVEFYWSQIQAKSGSSFLITQKEQFLAVLRAQETLDKALRAESADLFASDIRHAVFALEPVLGKTSSEDVLARIFSSFCIGK